MAISSFSLAQVVLDGMEDLKEQIKIGAKKTIEDLKNAISPRKIEGARMRTSSPVSSRKIISKRLRVFQNNDLDMVDGRIVTLPENPTWNDLLQRLAEKFELGTNDLSIYLIPNGEKVSAIEEIKDDDQICIAQQGEPYLLKTKSSYKKRKIEEISSEAGEQLDPKQLRRKQFVDSLGLQGVQPISEYWDKKKRDFSSLTEALLDSCIAALTSSALIQFNSVDEILENPQKMKQLVEFAALTLREKSILDRPQLKELSRLKTSIIDSFLKDEVRERCPKPTMCFMQPGDFNPTALLENSAEIQNITLEGAHLRCKSSLFSVVYVMIITEKRKLLFQSHSFSIDNSFHVKIPLPILEVMMATAEAHMILFSPTQWQICKTCQQWYCNAEGCEHLGKKKEALIWGSPYWTCCNLDEKTPHCPKSNHVGNLLVED